MATQELMTTQDKYLVQDHIVEENMAIVQPFLKEFAEKNPKIGTGFYSDVTILAGPWSDKFWTTEDGKEVESRWKAGEVSVYSVRWSGASFIIEYDKAADKIGVFQNVLVRVPQYTPTKAQFVYDGEKISMSLEVAMAARALFTAQEHRSALGAMLRQKSELGY